MGEEESFLDARNMKGSMGREDSVDDMTYERNLHRIVIVGGGAGGLELATRLGDKLGKRRRARIILVDSLLTHLWKPLFHEVAAGTLDSHEDRIEFLAQAKRHHFKFLLGRMDGLDRERRRVHLAPARDDEGNELLPRRSVSYDTLVLSVGSVTNDYGVSGVREHCLHLDNPQQAEDFHRVLLHHCLRAQYQKEPLRQGQLNVAIIGAGATGVELSAELHYAVRRLVAYGLDEISPERDVRLILIEAAEEILPSLPARVAGETRKELRQLGVEVRTGRSVTEVTSEGVQLEDGPFLPAQIKVWAAGIKGPDFLRDLDGLETNRLNQLVVHDTLQATRDERVFAMGDCAFIPQPGTEEPVPPRAQAAHQQASLLARSLAHRLRGGPLLPYVYRDQGSLISLSRYTAIGSLMGNLTGMLTVEGRLARLVYRALYRMHQITLLGLFRTLLIVLSDSLTRRARPRLKLH